MYSIGCLESQGSSCSVQTYCYKLLYLTVDGCTVTECLSHMQLYNHWLWLSRSDVKSCISMQSAITTVWQSLKPPQYRLSPPDQGNPLKLTMLTVETLRCFPVKTAVVLSQYTRVTDRRQTTSYNKSRTLQYNCNVVLQMNSLQQMQKIQKMQEIWYCNKNTLAYTGNTLI